MQTQPGQRPAANRPANQPAAVPKALADPFQLKPGEVKRLEEVLGFWQGRSSKVKTYECNFVRWEYDTTFGPADPQLPRTQGAGKIRYAAPDKGEFKVEKLGSFDANAPKQPIKLKPSDHEEHWICDGQSVFNLNGATKTLSEERLPPEMRGKGIAAGPLPFMFGAKKDELMTRYWMKEVLPPKERTGEYWIEARPKFRDDAANFQRILVILDQKNFLPTAMQVYPPTYDGKSNLSRTVYSFSERKVNHPLQMGQKFLGRFISPGVPRGWKKVVTNLGAPPAGQRPMNAKAPAARQAQQTGRPAATKPTSR